MKRVAIVRSDFPLISEPFIGGQIEAFRKWKPIVLRRGPEADHGLQKCVDVGRVRAKFLGLFPYIPAKAHVAAARRASLIHAHFGPDGVYARALARSARRPFVVTFHGYDATLTDGALLQTRQPSKLHYLALRQAIFRDASVLIAVSNFLRDEIIGRGANPEKVITHYIGVDISRFQPKQVRAENKRIRLITVARLVESKALHVAISALAQLVHSGFDLEYEIVGEGNQRSKLRDLAQTLGVENRVTFSGAVPHDDIMGRVASADIFLFPSRKNEDGAQEALGLAMVEAAACALPIVACDVGGIGEVVQNGCNGFLVPPNDITAFAYAVSKLVRDPAMRAAFGASGRAIVVQKFDLRKQSGALEEIYDSIAR